VKLTVIYADRWTPYLLLIHEGVTAPAKKRTVQIDLTADQVAALSPQVVGSDGGTEKREDLVECWIEPELRP
jgi:hypothetical protein